MSAPQRDSRENANRRIFALRAHPRLGHSDASRELGPVTIMPRSAQRCGTPQDAPTQIALLLQGGGALASFQCGAYQTLHAAGIEPAWAVGISSGALNATLIAGNPPERRVERLRAFWETISQPALPYPPALRAWSTFVRGRAGFFRPKPVPTFMQRYWGSEFESWYDVSPLRGTLERFADFDRINDARSMRLSLGVVEVQSGQCVYFDNRRERLTPEHVLASCALPPGFAPVEIDGRHYWDAGLVSNTPLECLLLDPPAVRTLAIAVDLWQAPGTVPVDSTAVTSVMQDLEYMGRTQALRAALDAARRAEASLAALLETVPADCRATAAYDEALATLQTPSLSVLDVIYHDKPCQDYYKTFDFSLPQIEAHWKNGKRAMRAALAREGGMLGLMSSEQPAQAAAA